MGLKRFPRYFWSMKASQRMKLKGNSYFLEEKIAKFVQNIRGLELM